jgi:hypothetical protein
MFPDKMEDLFPFLRVVRIYGPPGRRDGQSWTVLEVLGGKTSWLTDDVEALRAGLTSGPIGAVLQHELDRIVSVRGLLTDCALQTTRVPRG